MQFTINITNIMVDIFPYYDNKICKNYPHIFEFKVSDVDKKKEKNIYYANSRSIIDIDKIKI